MLILPQLRVVNKEKSMESANHEVVPGGTKGSSGVCFSMLHYFFATPKIFVPFQCWKLDSLSRVQVV